MKDLKNLIIIGLFVTIALLLTCNKPEQVEPEIITNTVTRVDSVFVTDTIVETINVPYAVVPLVGVETPTGMDLSDTSEFFTHTYTYAKKDSLLSYEIKIDGECEPVNVRMKYDVNQFTIRDSIYIRDSSHVKEILRKSYLAAGAMLPVGRDNIGFAPSLSYIHKSGSNFTLGYDVLNRGVIVGFSKKISLRRR